MNVDIGLVLVLAGLTGLTLFAWIVWPPLALAVPSVASLVAGLLTDWEAARGKPARTPPRR